MLGKLAWFGESGKCWVSRQKAECDRYMTPFFPTKPLRLFPVKKWTDGSVVKHSRSRPESGS